MNSQRHDQQREQGRESIDPFMERHEFAEGLPNQWRLGTMLPKKERARRTAKSGQRNAKPILLMAIGSVKDPS
jgi:hypothetical protein